MKNRSAGAIGLCIEGPWGRGHVAQAHAQLRLSKSHVHGKYNILQHMQYSSVSKTIHNGNCCMIFLCTRRSGDWGRCKLIVDEAKSDNVSTKHTIHKRSVV